VTIIEFRDWLVSELVEARRECEVDDEMWSDLAVGQDTEEAEQSGLLAGRRDTLEEVLDKFVKEVVTK